MPTLLILGIVVLGLLAALVALLQSRQRAKAAEAELATLGQTLKATRARASAEIGRLTESIRTLESSLARLARYETVADADEAAAELLRVAAAEAERLSIEARRLTLEAGQQSQELLSRAKEEAADVRADATEKAKEVVGHAEMVLVEARRRSDVIITDAHIKAEALAGDALKALQDARNLERAAEAMQNTIEGYGDRYLIPSHTLTDDLAADVGHTEAGQKLKFIREEIKRFIKAERAARCDYVEENRRVTAIRFIIDAFNGKADSVLARVKHDNAGTLQQELRDGFALVNLHGQAFRNARITEDYLTLRFEELQWASVAYQLKLEEREEQRRIKEQIREEEKARKEYERAIREAARDEEIVRRAMEKAQVQLSKATEEQRARYEEQLLLLQQKLTEAELRNQRALSMAQQTKRGHVYIISNVGSFGEHIYKIGLTRRLEPLDRIRELGDSSVPFEFDVHALIFAEDAPALEYQLHRHFLMTQVNKVNYRKEFFRVDLAHVREEIEKLGLATKWTMASLAAEYRESQRIEQLIKDDPAAREAWIRRQLTYEVTVEASETEEASV
jgi:hypothetical protein